MRHNIIINIIIIERILHIKFLSYNIICKNGNYVGNIVAKFHAVCCSMQILFAERQETKPRYCHEVNNQNILAIYLLLYVKEKKLESSIQTTLQVKKQKCLSLIT